MRDQDKILYFLKVVGPTIPSKVAKNIGTEILLASAHLSDLAAQGKVRISSLKIGGTPLYFLPGQEEQLYHFAAGNMNPKDFQVLDLLRQQRILRENSIDLLSKVALRSLKDFAVPLQVTVAGNKELFWKWHLLSDEEASSTIKQILFAKEEKVQSSPPLEEQQSLSQTLSPTLETFNLSPQKDEALYKTKREPEKISALALEQEALEDNSLDLTLKEQEDELRNLEKESAAVSRLHRPSTKIRRAPRKLKAQEDVFFPSAEEYLVNKEILIQEHEIIRKNAEINLLIKVPSVVGLVTYFCKVKKKAKCDEGDISSAYMEAQIKKLPLLLLYTGEITKKAQEMLATDQFQNAIIAKMDKH